MSTAKLKLYDLSWPQVIALTINLSPSCKLRNYQIVDSEIIKQFLKGKQNATISQTVSKNLNLRYEKSNDEDKYPPYLFYKLDKYNWTLTEEGHKEVNNILLKIDL